MNRKNDRFTFLLSEKEKKQFKELAEKRNRNGSILCRDFVKMYLNNPTAIENLLRPMEGYPN